MDAFRQRLSNRNFANFVKTCELAMHSVEDLETLNMQHENKQLVETLPSWTSSGEPK